MLPIRSRITANAIALPAALAIDDALGPGGLPLLRGELPAAADAPLVAHLRIHNSAGIPIIEGEARLAAGHQSLLFADLRPVGIDAYAHKAAEERAQIAARIWTRRAYGTLHIKR